MVMYLLHLSKCSSSCCQMGDWFDKKVSTLLYLYTKIWTVVVVVVKCMVTGKMLLSLKAVMITEILVTNFETYEGETDHLICQAAATPQLSKHARPLQHYKGRVHCWKKKHQNCSRSSDCPTWFVCHDDTHNQLQKSVSVDQNTRMQLLCAIK